MKRVCAYVLVGIMALSAVGAEIGGKFAFGFEQGVSLNDGSSSNLGRGCSFKLCLSNNVAVKAAVGFNYSDKINPVIDPVNSDEIYKEDKPRVDWTAAAYGIIVFRRFEKVHLNGMTGVVVSASDNHFNKESEEGAGGHYEKAQLLFNEPSKKMDIHLRVLMAPELFIFPNFSLEYKYGFDVAIKKEYVEFSDIRNESRKIQDSQNRLNINVIGDLNLLQSASVHFYF